MSVPLRLSALALLVACAPAVHAQVSLSMLNRSHWTEDTDAPRKQTYTFGDSGYTYDSGRDTGYMTHTGRWALIDGGRRLRLQAYQRIEKMNGRQRLRDARRTFVLTIEDIGDGFLTIDGTRFRRD